MNTKTFYDLILEDVEKGRTYTYAMYLATVNRDREDPLTFEQAADAHGHLLDFSGGVFSGAKLLKADQPVIVKQEEKPPLRSAPPVQDAVKEGVPKTGVETRSPVDQNDYTLCAINSKLLGGNALTAVLIAAVEFGLTSFKSGRRFGLVERELTAGYIADKMLKSRPVGIAALEEATKLGFLARLDNGKGGRGNTNKAKYRATVPAYMPAPVR